MTHNECPEFPYFGARYPDARCIDGYLWDLDSCDEPGGGLSIGGDDPCPFCNTESFIEHHVDDCEQDPPESTMTREKVIKWIEQLKQRYD